jgi:hypothetical protein
LPFEKLLLIFANPRGQCAAPDPIEAKRNLEYTLSRARPKKLAHDYLDLNSGTKDPLTADEHLDCSPEAIQARGRLAWAAAREKDQQSGASPEDIQRLARVRWQQYRKEGRGPRDGWPRSNQRPKAKSRAGAGR